MSAQDQQFKLRLPAEMRRYLEQSAREHKRSLTAEILARLEMSLKKEAFGINEEQPSYPSLENMLIEHYRRLTPEKKLALFELIK